ncbi:MAG: hypothetical protein H0X73_03785 [Chthoniobacterales bacterium]|nr:hypothetical protein [Chthoniobacterales bacterium]
MSQAAPQTRVDIAWLGELPCRVGQILIDKTPGEFLLCHRDDAGRSDLATSWTPYAASEIARYDDAGQYRRLKTAPNLRHGWLLLLQDFAALPLALDLFYPGRVAAYEAWSRDKLTTTRFRDTLARQSGMYRAAAKIGEQEADQLIANFCRSDGGCLRTILWKRTADAPCASTRLPPEKFDVSYDQTGRCERTLPLLCQEACNLLVAEARQVVKDGA